MAPRVPGASLQIGVDRFMRVAVPVKLPNCDSPTLMSDDLRFLSLSSQNTKDVRLSNGTPAVLPLCRTGYTRKSARSESS